MTDIDLRELQGLPAGPLFSLPVPLSDGPPPDTSAYDLCIVLPLHFNKSKNEYELSKDLYEILERIIQSIGRKYMYMYDSFYGWSRIILIRGGTARLKGKAEHLGIKLLLDKDEAKKSAFLGDKDHDIGRIEIVHREEVTRFEPFEYIYARYVMDPDMEHLYSKVENDDIYIDANTPKENVKRGPAGSDATTPTGVTNRKKDASGSRADKEEYHNSRIFHKSVRIELLMAILQDKTSRGGANLNLQEMQSTGVIEAFYPVHSSKVYREKFGQRILSSLLPWHLPMEDIKNYFGEKIAFYFAFTSHIGSWVIIPALMGVGCQVSALVQWDFNRVEDAVFALVISLWAIICYEFWKRKERFLSMRWGTIGISDAEAIHEVIRPTFHGTEIKSYIDGSDILYFEPKHAFFRYIFTGVVILVLIAAAFAAVAGIYIARVMLFASYNGDLSQGGTSIVNAVIIVILNFIARYVAKWLCDMENHRTDVEYEQSLVVKYFLFSFVNCYTSFYYLAFGAKYATGYLGVQGATLDNYNATEATAINLAMIFGVRYILLGILKHSLPWCKHWIYKFWHSKKKCRATIAFIKWFFLSALKKFICRYFCFRIDLAYDEDTYDEYRFQSTATEKVDEAFKRKVNRKNNVTMTEEEILLEQQKAAKEQEKARLELLKRYSPAEKEFRMFAYDMDGLASQYLDQIVIFGYMTLFVAALPGAVALGFISLMLEMRGDLWMKLHRYQRPIPQRAETIGLWRSVMEIMIVIAVCTNAGIVVFTMTTFNSFTEAQRIGIFILFQYGVFAVQYVLSISIPDEPREVSIQRQRQDFLAKKLVDKVPDKEGIDPLALL